jgi:hypothetical protein
MDARVGQLELEEKLMKYWLLVIEQTVMRCARVKHAPGRGIYILPMGVVYADVGSLPYRVELGPWIMV